MTCFVLFVSPSFSAHTPPARVSVGRIPEKEDEGPGRALAGLLFYPCLCLFPPCGVWGLNGRWVPSGDS